MSELSTAAAPAATGHPIVRIDHVTKRFSGNVIAVNDVSLDIERNEFFALLGPSGCGKTTLLRMLAGFETPSSGRIFIDGQDTTTIPPNRRPVNMVFQSYAVFPHMTVADNVAYGLKVTGTPRAEIGSRVKEALEMVRLGHLGDRKPDQLSGGQRQRVALARALIKRPKVLLLDEPLSALDKKLREEMQLELVRLRHEVGITFVIVTHDQEEAMAMASRIGVMESGQIAQMGPPDDIYEHPKTRFVADFIGSINLFDGRVAGRQNGQLAIECAEIGTRLVVEDDGRDGGLTDAAIGVRPEKILVSGARPEGAVNVVPGEVLEIAYLGEKSVFHVRCAGGRVVKATMTNERRIGGPKLSGGDPVFLSWVPSSGILLTV